MSDPTIDWLLDGDPAIRWQVHADLLDDPATADGERAAVASDGWSARLLASLRVLRWWERAAGKTGQLDSTTGRR